MTFGSVLQSRPKTRSAIAAGLIAVGSVVFSSVAWTDAPALAPAKQASPTRPEWETDIQAKIFPIIQRLPAADALRELDETTVVLRAKYTRNPRALMHLLRCQPVDYKDLPSLHRAAAEGLEHRALQARVIMNQAIRHARAICDLGDAFRDLGKPDEALARYAEVHDFPLPKPPLCDHARLAEFDEIRTRATLAILALVPADEVYQVRYVPEHLSRIEDEFPDKVRRLLRGHSFEEIDDKVFHAKLIVRDATSADADPKLKPHCQALLEFIRAGGF